MKLFLKPDNTWLGFDGITSYDDYCNKFVPNKVFAANVDTQIIDSYEVVYTMLTMSWYYYPLYDEARNKMLRIFELAVRIVAKNKGLTLEDKEGRKTALQVLVDQLPIKNKTIEVNSFIWYSFYDRFKKKSLTELNGSIMVPKANMYVILRNEGSHPDIFTVGAALGGKFIYEDIIDLINEMFE